MDDVAETRVLPMFDAATCAAIAKRVREARPHWTRRHPIAPFFTLGAAAYLDHGPSYVERARRGNAILGTSFRDVIDGVAARLAAALEAPVTVTARHAMPGFHIYEPFFAFAGNVASLHWDRQHHQVDWGGEAAPGNDEVWSVTVPMALPEGGAGLQIWTRHRASKGAARRLEVMKDPGAYTEIGYTVGEALLHDGQCLHRASLMPRRRFGDGETSDDPRITLQGHLARRGAGWEFYW